MSKVSVNGDLIRRFLLGKLDQEERQLVEESFVTDAETREQILMAEDDLVEEYLDDSLSPDDRSQFLQHYLCAPRQRRKLRIAESLRAQAVNTANESVSASTLELPAGRERRVSDEKRSSRFKLGWHNSLILLPLAAAVIIALVIGVIWLIQLRQANTQTAQEHSAIERELAELNAPADGSLAPTQFLSFALPPISIRSLQPPAELTLPTKATVVELWLLWNETKDFQSYQAMLKKTGAPEQFTIRNLSVENKPQGKAVRLRIPVHILTRGVYEVILSGVSADGKTSEPSDYTFTVSGQ